MASAQIFYNAFAFHTGNPIYSRKESYPSEKPGMAARERVITFTVTVRFLEPSFADNEARYRELLAALTTTEGILKIVDENGSEILNKRARVVETDRPKQWGQHLTEVLVGFSCVEDLTAGSSALAATFTPAGGAAVVTTLPNVEKFTESIKSGRFNPRVPNRRETIGTIVMTGRKRPTTSATVDERRAELLELKASLEAVNDAKEGVLEYAAGGFTKTVRPTVWTTDVGDATDELTWSLTAEYQRFPSGTHAEADFRVTTRDGRDRSERILSVRGTVRSNDLAGARAKVEAIKQSFTVTGRILLGSEDDNGQVSGSDGDEFMELGFSLEFREVLAVTSFQFNVSTRADRTSGNNRVIYSGRVTAATVAAASAMVTELAAGKYPFLLGSEETVSTINVAGTENFISVDFSYEYQTRGTLLWADISATTDRATFGAHTYSVSGSVTAANSGTAQSFARGLKLAGALQRTDRETTESVSIAASTVQFQKVSFSYVFHLDALIGAVQYTKEVDEELTSREATVTYSGTAYGPNEAAADAQIALVIQGETGRRMRYRTSTSIDRTDAYMEFMAKAFTVSFTRAIIGGSGDDIIEAEVTTENIYSTDHSVLTPIPFGGIDVQSNCGLTIGSTTVSGQIVTLNPATGVNWARAKAPAGYKQESVDREALTTHYRPFSGTTVRQYRLAFSYGVSGIVVMV